ncbi:MAG: hypothetical protein J2P58_01970 [Acidimicrobiaceae bacterium]|nr:hypothetical protein [Acidimicrobiaceae bacterium]
MENLVIGIPARNEAATIAELAETLEVAADLLGEGIRSELVLAYQPGGDETLERWHSRQFKLPNRVLYSPDGVSGKGRNVKQLILYAREASAHLLLVDADLRFYRPSDVARFVGTDRLGRGGMTLPLWCRPRGQGNTTDFLACPLLYALFGARIRHPLAGQMILTNKMLETIELDDLPDDYGIDVALTIQGLNEGIEIDQVVVPFPGHEAGGNSGRIMEDVAKTTLAFLAPGVESRRTDVSWPDEWWEGQTILPPSTRSLRGLIDELVSREQDSYAQHGRLTAMLDGSPAEVRDFWCDHLASAVLSAQAGLPIEALVSDLVGPFLVHAEYRRRVELDFAGAEAYVAELGTRLAAAIS